MQSISVFLAIEKFAHLHKMPADLKYVSRDSHIL